MGRPTARVLKTSAKDEVDGLFCGAWGTSSEDIRPDGRMSQGPDGQDSDRTACSLLRLVVGLAVERRFVSSFFPSIPSLVGIDVVNFGFVRRVS